MPEEKFTHSNLRSIIPYSVPSMTLTGTVVGATALACVSQTAAGFGAAGGAVLGCASSTGIAVGYYGRTSLSDETKPWVEKSACAGIVASPIACAAVTIAAPHSATFSVFAATFTATMASIGCLFGAVASKQADTNAAATPHTLLPDTDNTAPVAQITMENRGGPANSRVTAVHNKLNLVELGSQQQARI